MIFSSISEFRLNDRNGSHGGRLVTRWFGDLLEKEKPVAKFQEKDISPYFWPQGREPDSEEYRAHLAQQLGLACRKVETSLVL